MNTRHLLSVAALLNKMRELADDDTQANEFEVLAGMAKHLGLSKKKLSQIL